MSRSHAHAAWMLGATLAALVGHRAAWAGGLALLPFVWWLWRAPEVFFAAGRVQLANLVTTLRLALVVAMLVLPGRELIGAVALVALLLDGADGWLARRLGQESPFGALYDTEVDAFWVLQLCLILHLRDAVPAWVLVAGLWRYSFVLAAKLWPPRFEPRARTRLGRWLFLMAAVLLIAAFLAPSNATVALAAAANVVVSLSFLRSLWQAYVPGRNARQAAVAFR